MLALTTLINGCRETQALEDGVWFVGRGEMCRVRLDFPDVSERHAMLVVRNGTAVLKDLNSANGTYVNGEELQGEVALDGSMVVQIGESMLRVSDGDEEGEPDSTRQECLVTSDDDASQGSGDGQGGRDIPVA